MNIFESDSGESLSTSDTDDGGKYTFSEYQVPKVFHRKEHPFQSNYYDLKGYHECKNEGTARRLVSLYTLEDCQKFRNKGYEDLKAEPMRVWADKLPEPEVPMVSTIDFQKPHAYYVVVKHLGYKDYVLEAVHREVPANDRPDLFRILKSRFSRNTENAESYLMMEGDLIVVYKLRRRTTMQTRDVDLTFDTVKKDNNRIFWEVLDYSVVVRRMAEDVPIVGLKRFERKEVKLESLQKKKGRNKSELKIQHKKYYVGLDELQLIVGDADLFENVPSVGILNYFYSAKVFYPMVNPGQLLSIVSEGQEKYNVLYETVHHNNGTSFLPTIVKVGKLNEQIAKMLELTLEKKTILDNKEAEDSYIDACLTMSHFGLSAKYALLNKDRDPNIYTTEIIDVTMGPNGPVIEFDVFQTYLEPNSQITVSFSNTNSVSMVVLSCKNDNRLVRISAEMTKDNSTLLPDFNTLRGRSIIVKQDMIDFTKKLDAFSKYTSLFHLGVRPDTRAFLLVLIERCCGGQYKHPWNSALTKQEVYYKAFDRYPVVLLDGAVSTGKSYTVARTAIRLAQKSNLMHVITAKSEKDTIQLVGQFLRRIKQVGERKKMPKAVRLHDKRIDFETTIDFDKLMPKALKSYVLDIDEKWTRRQYPIEEVDSDLTTCAVNYLVDNGWLDPNVLRSREIHGRLFIRNFSPTYSPVKCFVKIYKPDIIIGKISTLVREFADDWYAMSNSVATVQIDEAQRIQRYEGYSLAFTFPRAKFAMVGNVASTQVRKVQEMPKTLSVFYGSTPFRHATVQNPIITFKLEPTFKLKPLGGVRTSGFAEYLTGKRQVPEFEDPSATWTESFSDWTE